MNDFYIGLITTIVVVVISELKFLEKKLIAAMTLVGIPFIYIGFTWRDTTSLAYAVTSALVFVTLAYFGYKRNFILVVAGLALHGIWDIIFPSFSTLAPDGYDVFCITIDLLLAVYFYFRVKTVRQEALSEVH